MPARILRSKARDLLGKLLAMSEHPRDTVCRALMTTERDLILYAEGLEPIPIEQQMCLAAFLVESVPPLARDGHQLRGQLKARVAFVRHDTEVHSNAPTGRFR